MEGEGFLPYVEWFLCQDVNQSVRRCAGILRIFAIIRTSCEHRCLAPNQVTFHISCWPRDRFASAAVVAVDDDGVESLTHLQISCVCFIFSERDANGPSSQPRSGDASDTHAHHQRSASSMSVSVPSDLPSALPHQPSSSSGAGVRRHHHRDGARSVSPVSSYPFGRGGYVVSGLSYLSKLVQ